MYRLNKFFSKITFFILICLFISCSENESFQSYNNNSLNHDFINQIKKETENKIVDEVQISKLFKKSEINKSNENSSIIISTEEIDLQNLNDSFNGFPQTSTIVSIGFFKNNDIIDWVFIHYYDSNNILRFTSYEVDNTNNLELTSYDEIIVSNVTLDNILFVANQLAPGYDIEIIGIKSLLTMEFNSPYDDLKLINFRDSYNLENFDINDDLSFEGETRSACGIVHQCWNGLGICHPFGGGCRAGTCPHNHMNMFIQANNSMINDYSLFNDVFSLDRSYQIRDELNTTKNGSFFVDAFYTISDHFNKSTDLELAIELVSQLNYFDEMISAFNSNNNNFIVTEAHIESIKSVLLMSSNKSDSYDYKTLINDFLKISDKFKNKTINEIRQELSN